MRIFAILKIAFRALKRNKLRSFLTMLGIIFGVGAVIVTVSVGNGAKAMIEAQIASLGQNVILIFSGSTTRGGINTGWGSAGTLSIDDATAIEKEVPGVASVSPEVRSMSQVASGNQNWFTQILGEGEQYLDIRQWPLTEGAMFTEQDVRGANKVTVIGATIARQLYGETSPVGQNIRVRNVPFTIVGVLAGKGMSMMGSDQDDVLIIPYTSAMKRISGTTTLRTINVQTEDPELLASVQQQIGDLLRQRHRIQAGRDDDFTVRNQQEIAQAATATSAVMRFFLAAVAGVSLLVGGIGIMNIMLVSVTERTREIGIRMAVGAKGRDILLQFLLEAVALSAIGGSLGIAIGVIGSKILSAKQGWPTLTSSSSVIFAFVFSAAVGVFFGFYPARKASRLDPIDALRYE
jgi:putative ABC transport system permease protein